MCTVLEVMRSARPCVPRHVFAAIDDVVAGQRAHRDELDVLDVEALGEAAELRLDLAEHGLVPAHEVHLVDSEHEVRDAQERRDERVTTALLDEAVPRVDEDDREVRGRGAGHHVARVLDVPGVSAMMNLRRGVAK
jgi:hypothetical protein